MCSHRGGGVGAHPLRHWRLLVSNSLHKLSEADLALSHPVLQPYHPEDFLPLIFGLILLFFGGSFPVLIAAAEAFRITGW